jgi:hypothetical protein
MRSLPIIQSVNLEVSVDTYYRLLKEWGGTVSDSFHLKQSEVSDVQKFFLNWVSDNSKLIGRLTFFISCTKYGTMEMKEIHVDEIIYAERGWKLIEHY